MLSVRAYWIPTYNELRRTEPAKMDRTRQEKLWLPAKMNRTRPNDIASRQNGLTRPNNEKDLPAPYKPPLSAKAHSSFINDTDLPTASGGIAMLHAIP
jgi:hypothetical protein